MNPWTRFFLLGTASVGFIGFLPYRIVPFTKWKGGGLLGSLVGWGLLWLAPEGGPIFWGILLGIIALSIPVSHWAEKILAHHDDPRIVIDEVAGLWVAAIAVPRTLGPMMAALILFRVFDVFKGPWCRWAARAPGGWGVVADDLLAGLLANLLLHGFLRGSSLSPFP